MSTHRRSDSLVSPLESRRWLFVAGVIACGAVLGLLISFASSQSPKMAGVVFGGLLALGCWPMLAYFPGLVERTLLFALAFTLPISLKFHLAYRSEALGGAVGYRVSITEILALLLVASIAWRRRRGGADPIRCNRAIALAFGAYLSCAVLSAAASNDVELGLFQLSALLTAFALFVFLYNYLSDRARVRTFVAGMLCGVLLQAGIAIVQVELPGKLNLTFLGQSEEAELEVVDGNIALPEIDRGTTTVGGDVTRRPTGLLLHPNVLGCYLVIMIPAAFAVWLGSSKRWMQALGLAAFGTACIALYFSLSRSGWFGTAAAFGLAAGAWLAWGRTAIGARKKLVLAAMGIVVLAGIVSKTETIYLRLTETAGEAIEFRVNLMRAALAMVKEHPLVGVGLNTFVDVVEQYDVTGMSRLHRYPVHNLLMLELSEVGVLGGLAFLVLLVTLIVQTLKTAKRCKQAELQMLSICLACGMIGFWLADMTGFTYRIPIMTSLVWSCVALTLALPNVEQAAAR